MPGQPGLCLGAVSQTSSSPLPHTFPAPPSFSPLEPRQPQRAGKVGVWTPDLGEGPALSDQTSEGARQEHEGWGPGVFLALKSVLLLTCCLGTRRPPYVVFCWGAALERLVEGVPWWPSG